MIKFSSLRGNKSYWFTSATLTVICQPSLITRSPQTCCRNSGRIQGKDPRSALDSKRKRHQSFFRPSVIPASSTKLLHNLFLISPQARECQKSCIYNTSWQNFSQFGSGQFSFPFLFCCQNSEKGTVHQINPILFIFLLGMLPGMIRKQIIQEIAPMADREARGLSCNFHVACSPLLWNNECPHHLDFLFHLLWFS